MITLLVLIPTAAVVWGVVMFNRLVRLRTRMESAWADIDVQLTRRHDLVPRLVTAVKAFAAHERGAVEAVTQLRSKAISLTGPHKLGEVETALEEALARLLALREAYPELRANENFAQLQRDLVDVENHLQYARRFYNGAVRDYSTIIQRIPDFLVARAFGFGPREFFQAEEDQRSVPRTETSS